MKQDCSEILEQQPFTNLDESNLLTRTYCLNVSLGYVNINYIFLCFFS